MNALLFLIPTLFDLALSVLLLRVLLQLTRSDFYNPISQLVWKLTQPVLAPLTRVLPRWKTLDLAGVALALLLALVKVWVLGNWEPELFYFAGWFDALRLAVLMLVKLTVNLYVLTIFAQALLSWVGPGVNNPNANVLWTLNEPLLRPVRRLLPPVAGLDLSPMLVILVLLTLGRVLAAQLGNFG